MALDGVLRLGWLYGVQAGRRAVIASDQAANSAGHAEKLRALGNPKAIKVLELAVAKRNLKKNACLLVDAYAGPQHAHRKTMQRTYDGKDPAQYYVDSVILHGTPEAVVERIRQLEQEAGLNYLMCAPLSRQTFRLLADQVLPKL